jgi:hypothetical protein
LKLANRTIPIIRNQALPLISEYPKSMGRCPMRLAPIGRQSSPRRNQSGGTENAIVELGARTLRRAARREYVDGATSREPITEGQRKAVLRLNRAERDLGADGAALVHEVLILGMTMEQIAQRRSLHSQRWINYFARRFRECLDRLALIYGFAAEKR